MCSPWLGLSSFYPQSLFFSFLWSRSILLHTPNIRNMLLYKKKLPEEGESNPFTFLFVRDEKFTLIHFAFVQLLPCVSDWQATMATEVHQVCFSSPTWMFWQLWRQCFHHRLSMYTFEYKQWCTRNETPNCGVFILCKGWVCFQSLGWGGGGGGVFFLCVHCSEPPPPPPKKKRPE